ncbi:RIF1 [Candida jiufengensis]|uniref:RIF1 n=1 Tax=Candida jiufengensis TaxID=497108 RepID=UPI002224308C|nr:RIF1 [Candida jiufengensis]KAI5955845.1 RIF1 [Candida jiufengensis]
MAPVRRSSRNKNKTPKASSPKKNTTVNKRRSNKKNNKNVAPKIEVSSADTTIESDLNSSPIKRVESPAINQETNNQVSSSPIRKVDSPKSHNNSVTATPTKQKKNNLHNHNIRRKKSVLFSDDLVSDLPSTPDRTTPKRSILKTCDINSKTNLTDPNNSILWEKSPSKQPHGPKSTNFWSPGTIIQLPPNSDELPLLLEGCLAVLKIRSFDRKFEVYATLNAVYKSNPSQTLLKLFTTTESFTENEPKQSTYLQILISYLIRDIEEIEEQIFTSEADDKENTSPTKNDPFRVRIVNQALKLLNFFMSDTNLNDLIRLEDAEWVYRHASLMLTHPRISKNLVSPYLCLIKDCHLSPKRKRSLFSNCELIEKMLYALMNMNSFPSASLISEKLLCIKNYIINFPSFMSKNIGHWFEVVLLNLCNITSSLYLKCLGLGVHCLLEAAKTFLDNSNVHVYVMELLSSTISNRVKFFSSDEEFSQDLNSLNSQNVRLVDFIISKLQTLCDAEQYKLSLDLWMALTVLIGNGKCAFEKWPHLNSWLQVPRRCLESENSDVMELALNCWKAVNFNLCKNGLASMRKELDPILRLPANKDKVNMINSIMKPKIKLLTHVFTTMNISNLSDNVIASLHNLFLGLLYMMLGPNILRSWSKHIYLFWDKIIQPVFVSFYFKRDISNPSLNYLGLEILKKLLESNSTSSKSFSDMRILSNEILKLNDINSLPSKWVHSHFDKIMQNLYLVFSLNSLKFEHKLSFLTSFFNIIKPITKKENTPSTTTYDLIDNLPLILTQLLKSEDTNTSVGTITNIILELHDTFNPNYLIYRGDGDSINIYMSLLDKNKTISGDDLNYLILLVFRLLETTKVLIFIVDILKSDIFNYSNGSLSFISDVLIKTDVELSNTNLKYFGEICQFVQNDFDVYVKKLIQSIVSIPNIEETCRCLTMLNIENWTIECAHYVFLLLRGAPNQAIHQYVLTTLSKRLETSYHPTLAFLIHNDFAYEIYMLKDQIFEGSSKLDSAVYTNTCAILGDYIKFKIDEPEKNYDVIDQLALGCIKVFKLNLPFLKKNHLEYLPLVDQELKSQLAQIVQESSSPIVKRSLSDLSLSIPSVVFKDITAGSLPQELSPIFEEETIIQDLVNNNSCESSGLSEDRVEPCNTMEVDAEVEMRMEKAVPSIDQYNDLIMEEPIESTLESFNSNSVTITVEKSNKAETSESESLESVKSMEELLIVKPINNEAANLNNSKEETISESESTLITQTTENPIGNGSKEDTIANTSSSSSSTEITNIVTKEKDISSSIAKILPDSVESINSLIGQYDTKELVRLLTSKSQNELINLNKEEKYEIETNLLNFMIRLRQS